MQARFLGIILETNKKITIMGKLKILSIFLCSVAAFTLSSCIDDDDDTKSLTAEDVQQCFNATRGSYAGKLIYTKDASYSLVNNSDTVSASWAILTDSTMIFRNVPSAAIASAFTNSELKASVASKPDVSISCYIGYIQTSPIEWVVNPQSVTFDDVTYNGGTHKLQVAFYNNNLYSFGVYNSTNGNMQLQIIIAGAWLDGQYRSELIPNAIGLTFYKGE